MEIVPRSLPELFKQLGDRKFKPQPKTTQKRQTKITLRRLIIVQGGLIRSTGVVLVVALVAFRLVVRVVASHYCDYEEESHQTHHQDHQKQKKTKQKTKKHCLGRPLPLEGVRAVFRKCLGGISEVFKRNIKHYYRLMLPSYFPLIFSYKYRKLIFHVFCY